MIGTTMFTAALLGLAAAASVGISQTGRAREDTQYWGDAQQVIDSLMATGFGNITDDSTLLRGRRITWHAGSSASAPQQVTLGVARHGYANRFSNVRDTIVMFLAKTKPGS
jgi:hypothetical protein